MPHPNVSIIWRPRCLIMLVLHFHLTCGVVGNSIANISPRQSLQILTRVVDHTSQLVGTVRMGRKPPLSSQSMSILYTPVFFVLTLFVL